jgi:uncharacterized protein (TIGR00255 family)
LIHSMTGYAEKTFVFKTFSARINIRTLNHRFFDWSYRGSPISSLEDRLRNACRKKLNRGRIEVSVDLLHLRPEKWQFWINKDLLRKILSAVEKASPAAQNKMKFSLENLFHIPHVVEFQRRDFTKQEAEFLERSFEKTLNQLIGVRAREGKEIKSQLKSHMQNIRIFIHEVEKRAKKQPLLIKKRLTERLEEMNRENTFSENRLAEEASFLAQRYDLTEEIARLKSHLKYFGEVLSSVGPDPVGKKLDFVAQELYREANTINSKAQDIEVIRGSLSIKSEVESIRQQVQNIE